MQITVVYNPKKEELKSIEDSWLEDFKKNPSTLHDFFLKSLGKRIIVSADSTGNGDTIINLSYQTKKTGN